MSIASRITAMQEHLRDDYDVLTLAGADLTNVDKNIVNLKPTWKERLLYFMNNGTDEVWNNWDKVTGEGTSLTLNNTLEAKMKIKLKGNTYQEGTPNPDYPQDVHVVSGDNTIEICGKNLYNVNDRESVATEVVIDNDSWISVSYDNTSGSTNKIFNCRMKASIFLKPDTTYKVVVEVKSISGTGVLTFNEGANQQSQIYDGFINDFSALSSNSVVMRNAKTWASLEGKSRLSTQYVYFRPGQSGSITFRVSLIEDTTLTPSTFTYEPYIGNTYPIYLGDIELCKIGTYQDYIYKDNGSWYLHKEIGKVVLDGTNIPFTTKSASTVNDIWVTNNIFEINDYVSGYSNHFKVYTTSLYGVNEIGIYFESKRIRCCFGANSSMTSLDIANQFLQDNNVEVLFPLKVATNTLIEDTTLIEQLEALKLATSYATQTNISQENNDNASIISAVALSE